jgi:hypothetical protein
MVKSYEAAMRAKRIGRVVVPVVWLVVVWVMCEVVGRGVFGLDGVWTWLVGAVCAVLAIPVAAFLLYLGVVLVWPLITGKKVDWR